MCDPQTPEHEIREVSTPTRRTAAEDYPRPAQNYPGDMVTYERMLAEIDRLRAQVASFANEIVQMHQDRDVYDSALEAQLDEARDGLDERDRIIIERDNEIAGLRAAVSSPPEGCQCSCHSLGGSHVVACCGFESGSQPSDVLVQAAAEYAAALKACEDGERRSVARLSDATLALQRAASGGGLLAVSSPEREAAEQP